MINQSDAIRYDKLGFDGDKYIKLQRDQIVDRVSKFPGRLYLEIGGKFLYDSHASRVLPWFDPESKIKIFSGLKDSAEIVFCTSARDLDIKRQLSNEDISYEDYVFDKLENIKKILWMLPYVVINFLSQTPSIAVIEFEKKVIPCMKKIFDWLISSCR